MSRFSEIVSIEKIVDNVTDKEYNGLVDDEFLTLVNKIIDEQQKMINQLKYENDELRNINRMLGVMCNVGD